LERTSIS
jgi:hypothetical protein